MRERLPTSARSLFVFSDDTKEAVFFVSDSSGEKDAVAEWEKIPQALKLERCSIGSHERLDEVTRNRIVVVDAAITEVSDPEPVLNESKSPWRVQLAV